MSYRSDGKNKLSSKILGLNKDLYEDLIRAKERNLVCRYEKLNVRVYDKETSLFLLRAFLKRFIPFRGLLKDQYACVIPSNQSDVFIKKSNLLYCNG